MSTPIEPSDAFCIQSADGWLGLGNVAEAAKELANVSPGLVNHPAVLRVQWGIRAAEKNWEQARAVAAKLIEIDPDEPLGWVDFSYALHELKRTAEARDSLLRVVEKFPISATIRYNLACYECQLGNLPQAKRWLEKAFRLGDRDRMKASALADRDLEPLWPELGSK